MSGREGWEGRRAQWGRLTTADDVGSLIVRAIAAHMIFSFVRYTAIIVVLPCIGTLQARALALAIRMAGMVSPIHFVPPRRFTDQVRAAIPQANGSATAWRDLSIIVWTPRGNRWWWLEQDAATIGVGVSAAREIGDRRGACVPEAVPSYPASHPGRLRYRRAPFVNV